MKFHDELNPKLWDGLELKPEVKEKLNEIAEAFKEYLDIPEDAILDIRITGSSASYNYTEYSDLDLHLIIDYEKVHEDCPLVEGYLWSYKSQFNANHDISIYDVPVELYAEDSKQEAISNGVYSLMEDRWLKEPKKIPPTDNDEDVQAKYQELKDAIDKCDDSEVAGQLLDKIYTMRKSGLAEVGEFSTENMAFKLLRNDGSIDKLKKLKKEKVDKQLSLESYNEEMYTDEKDVPPLHDYAIIFKYQEPWPDGKLAYRAIMKLTTGTSYRMQSWSYTKEGMINIVKKQWPYADIVDKTNEYVSESYNKSVKESYRRLTKTEMEIEKLLNANGFKTSEVHQEPGKEKTIFYVDKSIKLDGMQPQGTKVSGRNFKEILKKLQDKFNKNESIKEDYELHGPGAKVTFDNEKLETLEDLKNYFDTGLETIDCEITYFPYEPTQKVLRITSASPKINREWLKEVSNGKIKLVGVKQHKNRFGGWIKMYDHFYGYVDNINESKNDLYIVKAMVVGLGGKDIKYLVYRNDRLSDTRHKDLATPLPKTQWQEILNQQGKNYRIGNAVFTFKKYFDPDGGNYIILRYTPQTAEGTLTLQDIKKQLSKQQIKIAHVECYKQYQRYGKPTTAYRIYIDKQYEEKLRNFVKVNTPVADIQIQESIRNTGKFNVGDKVRKGKRIATIKKVDSPEKGYLDVEFEDKKDNGSYPKQYFRKITESKDMITTINKLIDNVNKTMKTASKNPKEVNLYKLEQETNKDGEVLLTLYKGNKKFMTAKLVGNTLLGDDIVGHLKSVKSFKYNENIDNEFKHTYKFNSVGDYKDKLKDMRAKYDVQDVIEDNNLLHLVYDGDTHIGTFNNTKLEYYSDDTTHIKECYNITKLLEEVDMEIRKYKVKLKADNGEEVKITTTATSVQQAIKQVCDQQNAPESAVVSVKECDLDEGFSSIINKLSQLLG